MSCLNFHRRIRLHDGIALCGQERRHRCAGQVAGQLQALLAEKARLASENARLAHENTSLQVKTRHLPLKAIHAQQELLTYSSSLWQQWKEDYSTPFRKCSPQ